MGLERQVKKAKEKIEQKKFKELYGRKPKRECPRCHKKSLFFTNEKKEVFCVRCNEKISIKN